MGIGNSKSKRKQKHHGKGKHRSGDSEKHFRDGTDSENDFGIEFRERWLHDAELNVLRHTIATNPEMFILNNLMMSTQFFENYDEEIIDIRKTLASSREAHLNANLPPQKHTLIPDVLQQHVSRKIDFTYILPNHRHTIELLQPIRIYVIFDNVEVTEESYAASYCSINETITYSMQLKPSTQHKGYVQLQQLEVSPPKKTMSVGDLRMPQSSKSLREGIYSDSEAVYGRQPVRPARTRVVRSTKKLDLIDDDSTFEDENSCDPSVDRVNRNAQDDRTIARKDVAGGKNPGVSKHVGKGKLRGNGSPAGSMSSGYRSGNYMDIDSDYGYAQTNYSDTPKSSKSSMDDGTTPSVSSTEIPQQCFQRIEYRADGKIYDARREKRLKMTAKERLIWQAHQSRNYEVWYLNSTRFMKYFCRIFTDHLGEQMGFEGEMNGSVSGSVIYRDRVEVLEDTMNTRVETFEIVPCVSCQWPESAQEWLDRARSSWPDYNMVEKVREFGCHVVPENIVSEEPGYRYHDLEWQLIFPAAERYLETCLTYSQVRVYLISLMLHKTFIKPIDSIFGLTTIHIKHRLFWLVEEDDRPTRWLGNRMGEALVRLLNSLYRSISQDEPTLMDFFVKGKNLFQEKSCLLRTQKQLKRIIENPVMYVFHAMENIRHSRRFFPRLNYEELLRILSADILTVINPALAPKKTNKTRGSTSSGDYDHIGSFWDSDQRNKSNDKPRIKRPVINRSCINPRRADDHVIEIPMRCAYLEPRRLACLLEFFLRHFIKMAEYCHRYRAGPQKMEYLDQAERLTILRWELRPDRDNTKSYLDQIRTLRRQPEDLKSQSSPPETPRRNHDKAVFVRTLKDRYRPVETLEEMPESHDESHTGYDSERTSFSEYNQRKLSDEMASGTLATVDVHEENVKNRKIEKTPEKSIFRGKKGPTNEKRTRVVSLSEEPEESFLTETTQI